LRLLKKNNMKRSVRRRRLESRTDYKARLEMLKSGKARVVIRKTNRYIIVQIVVSNLAQDQIIFGTSSKVLLTKGWPMAQAGSLKSLSAAYLTGFLVGKQSKDNVKEIIVDLGMHRNIQKSRIYAVVKGLVDSGLPVICGEKALPVEEDFDRNTKIKDTFTKVKKAL